MQEPRTKTLGLAAFGCWLVTVAMTTACSGDTRSGGNAGIAAGADSASGAAAVASGGSSAPGGSSGSWGTSDSGQVIVSGDPIVVTDDSGTWSCFETICEGHLLTCGNCLDDEGDGLIDARDQECLGPCDNSEGATLAAEVGGQSGGACKVDCYFDFGNGSGGDCEWDHRCDPLEPELVNECTYDVSLVGSKDCPAQQPTGCEEVCPALTPNGCDCFGCCTFPALATAGPGGGLGFVYIGALDADKVGTCTFDDVLDPQRCPACTPVENCFNGCGHCELCLGKDRLPAECLVPPDAGTDPPDGGAPGERCETGIEPCGLATDRACSLGSYCISGCCKVVPQ